MKGLAERLGAVDGLFVVDSPQGGPTTVTAELPWRDRDHDRASGRSHDGASRAGRPGGGAAADRRPVCSAGGRRPGWG